MDLGLDLSALLGKQGCGWTAVPNAAWNKWEQLVWVACQMLTVEGIAAHLALNLATFLVASAQRRQLLSRDYKGGTRIYIDT
jgi:hypothetical protein